MKKGFAHFQAKPLLWFCSAHPGVSAAGQPVSKPPGDDDTAVTVVLTAAFAIFA